MTVKKAKTAKAKTAKKKAATKPAAKKVAKKAATKKKLTLLSGGNPQIAKGDGDAPVQEYIAAIQDWKRNAAKDLDALIVKLVPEVQKAVKWNTPFYGVEGQGWFIAYHCFNKYLKVTFFKGAELEPLPPEGSKDPNVRYFHIYEGDELGADIKGWIKQAAKLPGWLG